MHLPVGAGFSPLMLLVVNLTQETQTTVTCCTVQVCIHAVFTDITFPGVHHTLASSALRLVLSLLLLSVLSKVLKKIHSQTRSLILSR